MPGFRKLSALLIVAMVAFIVVPMAIVIFFSDRTATDQARKSAGNSLAGVADDSLDILYRSILERRGDARAFALNPTAGSGQSAAVCDLANAYTRLYGCYDLMVITDRAGVIIGVNTQDAEQKAIRSAALVGRSLADQPWFARIAELDSAATASVSSDVYRDPLVAEATGGDGLVMRFSAPIRVDGKVVGTWTNYGSWSRIVRQVMDDVRTDKLTAIGLGQAEVTLLGPKETGR